MSDIKKADYLVLRPLDGGTKFRLVRATKKTGKGYVGALESERKGLKIDTVSFTNKQVLLNLGPAPLPGKVYGLDLVNRFRKCIEHDFWGKILVFTSLDNATSKLVRTSLDKTAKKIEKLGLAPYAGFIDTHLVAKQGKWAGKYCHNMNKDEGDTPSVIAYAPECADNKLEFMNYIVFHEFGHALRYNGVLGKKLRMKWLNEYRRSIEAFEISSAQLKTMFKHLSSYIEGEESLSSTLSKFSAEDDEHKLWVRGLLRWFKEVHHMTSKELNIIWDNSDIDTLKELWPTNIIDSSKLAPVVSEYACTSVEETFSEVFAFYALGKKLPARLVNLMEESIKFARVKVDQEDL
jgi:hypothetical protein